MKVKNVKFQQPPDPFEPPPLEFERPERTALQKGLILAVIIATLASIVVTVVTTPPAGYYSYDDWNIEFQLSTDWEKEAEMDTSIMLMVLFSKDYSGRDFGGDIMVTARWSLPGENENSIMENFVETFTTLLTGGLQFTDVVYDQRYIGGENGLEWRATISYHGLAVGKAKGVVFISDDIAYGIFFNLISLDPYTQEPFYESYTLEVEFEGMLQSFKLKK